MVLVELLYGGERELSFDDDDEDEDEDESECDASDDEDEERGRILTSLCFSLLLNLLSRGGDFEACLLVFDRLPLSRSLEVGEAVDGGALVRGGVGERERECDEPALAFSLVLCKATASECFRL